MMKTNRSLFLLLLVAYISAATINADSYINLPPQGYAFSFSNAQGPVQLTIMGLPDGLIVQNYTVSPIGPVVPGQYILSVRASDNVGKDEKILIMNVDPNLTAATPKHTTTTSTATTTSSSSSQSSSSSSSSIKVETSSTSTNTAPLDISSMSALFQTGPTLPSDASSSSVDSLQSFFNNIDTSSTPAQNRPISNSLSQILTDFSNANTTYTETNIPSLSAQTLVTQNSISLNFTNSQRNTVSNEEANRLFQQQKQASQWVAGNYSIVMQLTADKSTLNILIANLTQKYQQDQLQQKAAADQLNIAVNNKSKVQSAIGNLNTLLTNLQTQIGTSSSRISQLQSQRRDLLSQAGQTQSNLQQVTQNIQTLTNQIQASNASLASNTRTCDGHSNNLLQANKTLNIYNSQLGLVDQQLNTAGRDIAAKKAIVDDLMRQLALAQQQLQLAQDNSNSLSAQKTQLQQNITATGNSVVSISQNLNSCTAQSSSLRQAMLAQQANLTALQATLAQYGNQNNTQTSQITSLQSLIAQETSNLNSLQNQSNSATGALSLLQAALPNVTSTLASRTNSKNQADLTLQNSLATLQAAISSFKNYSSNLQMATMHLQNARALSQQADQAVNSMLAQKGTILPFAVAVNSSSPLIGQTIVSSSVNIANWFNYLSANFGTVAFPYQTSQVNCLYPFSLASLNLRNSVPCPAASDPLQTITGKIVKINSFNQIIIAVDNSSSQQTIQIPSCAQLNSNISAYKVSLGDSALVKGAPQSSSTIIAKSILFLRA